MSKTKEIIKKIQRGSIFIEETEDTLVYEENGFRIEYTFVENIILFNGKRSFPKQDFDIYRAVNELNIKTIGGNSVHTILPVHQVLEDGTSDDSYLYFFRTDMYYRQYKAKFSETDIRNWFLLAKSLMRIGYATISSETETAFQKKLGTFRMDAILDMEKHK